MSRPFAITAASNSVFLDEDRMGKAQFTVSNQSGRSIEGRARLIVEGADAGSWIVLRGPAQRSFSTAGTEQYTVEIDVPPDASSGNYVLRLDMVGEERPDEQYVEGPSVTFQVPEPEPDSGPFPWSMVAAVAAVLVIGVGFLLYQVLSSDTRDTTDSTSSDTAVVEQSAPNVWARGTTCLTFGQSFDLDEGTFESAGGDLFYHNVDGMERYLEVWRGSRVALGGSAPLDQVSYEDVENAQYHDGGFDASYGEAEVRPGTTWFVHTSEGRYAKVRIQEGGQYIKFDWVTFAKEGERGTLTGSPFQNGICSPEEARNCGTGKLPGDEVQGFEVVEGTKTSEEATLEVDLSYNQEHGEVYVVPLLIDANGENISGGYRPTRAEQGTSRVPVIFTRPGKAQSEEIFIYLFESGTPSEAFICERFRYEEQWGSS